MGGGGVGFKGSFEIEKFLKKNRQFKAFKKLFSSKVDYLNVSIDKDRNNNISLEIEMVLDLKEYDDKLRNAIIQKEREELEALKEKLEDFVNFKIEEIQKNLIKYGQDYFNNIYLDETIKEEIEVNEYQFLEDGEQF